MFRAAIFATVANLAESITIDEGHKKHDAQGLADPQEEFCKQWKGESLKFCIGEQCKVNDFGYCESTNGDPCS